MPEEEKAQSPEELIADERLRVARDLHDCTSQMLVVLQLDLGRLKRSGGGPEVASLVEEIEQVIHEMREQIRALGRE